MSKTIFNHLFEIMDTNSQPERTPFNHFDFKPVKFRLYDPKSSHRKRKLIVTNANIAWCLIIRTSAEYSVVVP